MKPPFLAWRAPDRVQPAARFLAVLWNGWRMVVTRTEAGGFPVRTAVWQVHIEEPVMSTYKGIEVYKLTTWVQGPAMLQALNILENFDVKSMGYNSARYIHTLYQSMNLAFADRDFYYGDPYFPPDEVTHLGCAAAFSTASSAAS